MIVESKSLSNIAMNENAMSRKDYIPSGESSAREEFLMIFDSEESLNEVGFSSHVELPINKHLYYFKRLDEEANNFLDKIKANIGRCVIMRDINSGCIYWSHMVSKYIALYGLRFKDDELIAFVKLYYELIIIPNLKSSTIEIFGHLFVTFLKKKKERISPKKLQLQWQPLFEMCEKIITRRNERFFQYSPEIENILHSVVFAAKVYFPPSTTQEVLDVLRPKIYPFDEKRMHLTFKLFQWFLPVQLFVHHHIIGHELWLREFMQIWENCNKVSHWEKDLMELLAKLASNNIGYIDWSPYIPIMYTRFIRNLQLPVDYKYAMSGPKSLQMCHIAEWMVSVMENKIAEGCFEKFMKSTESYFNPHNKGPWSENLIELANKLVTYFVSRLSKERHMTVTWEISIPNKYKLSEKNVDFFVRCMLPVAMITIYDDEFLKRTASILKYLAMIRPELVITQLMEKLNFSVDEPLEDYKFCTVMDTLTLIRKPFISGKNFGATGYSEGPFLIIRLLFLALPGIDRNSTTKTFKAITFITAYAQLVPIVDCSKSKKDLKPEIQKLCEATRQFKQFITDFMDRVFDLILNGSFHFTQLEVGGDHFGTTPESITERILEEAFDSLLLYCEAEMFQMALKKYFTFITERSYEIEPIGRLLAVLANVFARNNIETTFRMLLPYLSGKIQSAIGTTKKVLEADAIEQDLLFPLELCARLVKDAGCEPLIPFMITLNYMLKKATFLKNEKGNELAAQILRNVLESLTTAQPIRSEKNFDFHHPYWNDWGRTVNPPEVKIKWFVPSAQGNAEAEKLFQYFFMYSIKILQEHTKKPSLPRFQLQRNLRIINAFVEGLDAVFPMWYEPPVVLKNCSSCTFSFKPIIGKEREITMTNNRNVRFTLVNAMAALQATILRVDENDKKSFLILAQIWENLSMNKIKYYHDLNVRLNAIKHQRISIENKLEHDKGYTPKLFYDRVALQHDLRRMHGVHIFTPTSKQVVLNLYTLCINKHTIVREKAQSGIWTIFNAFPFTYHVIIPNILETLSLDPDENREAHKGVLFLINNSPKNSLLTKGDWQLLASILPAIVLLKPGKKFTITRELKYTSTILAGNSHTIAPLNLPESCVDAVSGLWNTAPYPPVLSEAEVNKGTMEQISNNETYVYAYNEVFEKLITIIIGEKLDRSQRLLAMQYMSALMQPDYPFPTKVVSYFLQTLIDEDFEDRKIGFYIITHCLRQDKRVLKKKTVQIPNREKKIIPGRRDDNEWLQYDFKKLPRSIEAWEEARYMHGSWVGYYGWPKNVKMFIPTLIQPSIDKRRKLNPQEDVINKFFLDKKNVKKFIEYLAAGEGDNDDKFNYSHFYLMKTLFCNFGDSHLAHMLPHMKNLSRMDQENFQRSLIEILAAIMCASKHWSYPMNANTWKKILPIFKDAQNKVIEQTIDDWTICLLLVQTNRDFSKIHWLLEFFIEDAENTPSRGLVECAKLTFLRCIIENQVWRLSEPLNRLLPLIEERLLEDPIENVRRKLAAILVVIFNSNLSLLDLPDNTKNLPKFISTTTIIKKLDYPSLDNFMEKMLMYLEPLVEYEVQKEEVEISHSRDKKEEPLTDEEIEENFRRALIVLVTMCVFILESYESSYLGKIVPHFYKLYPIIIKYGPYEAVELDMVSELCGEALSALARFWTQPKYVPLVLKTIDNVFENSTSLTIVNNMQFLLVWLFHNMSTVLNNKVGILTIQNFTIRLLQDKRIVVREKAAEMLASMIHCSIWPDEAVLMKRLMGIGNVKLPNKKHIKLGDKVAELEYSNAIRLRHSAVLGMCAFIRAHPYDIPKEIPPIFTWLKNYVNDPPPIPATIQITFNEFKRTHLDSWSGIESLGKFMTEEEFEILQDFTIPPSYIT